MRVGLRSAPELLTSEVLSELLLSSEEWFRLKVELSVSIAVIGRDEFMLIIGRDEFMLFRVISKLG